MQLDRGRGGDQPGRALAVDGPRLEAALRLLDGDVLDTAFAEQAPDDVRLHVAGHARGLVDHQHPMLQRGVVIDQGALAEGAQDVAGGLGEQLEHRLHEVGLAGARWPLHGQADDAVEQARDHDQEDQLHGPLLACDTEVCDRSCNRGEDVFRACQGWRLHGCTRIGGGSTRRLLERHGSVSTSTSPSPASAGGVQSGSTLS